MTSDSSKNSFPIEAHGGKLDNLIVSTPLEVCEEREVKGLCAKARHGLLKHFTGIEDPDVLVQQILLKVKQLGYL